MTTLLSAPPTLALLDMEFGHLIPIVAIIAPFVMIIATQISKSIARTQQERMRCEVMRAAIERGQPIPAEALRPLPDEDIDSGAPRAPSPQNDIRTGLICMAVGAGLFVMLGTFSIGGYDGLQGLRWVGAIPGFVGVALLAYGMVHRGGAPAGRPRETRAPDSRGDLRS